MWYSYRDFAALAAAVSYAFQLGLSAATITVTIATWIVVKIIGFALTVARLWSILFRLMSRQTNATENSKEYLVSPLILTENKCRQ